MDDELALALRAARTAGRIVMRHFGADPVVTHKTPDQPLTAADLEADEGLKEVLRGARPDHGWLSEETADHPDRLHRRRVWIVDPIDGTRSFIAGRREFAVSIGLVEDGTALLGVVYNPSLDELYWAVRGRGAYAAAHGRERDGIERAGTRATTTEGEAPIVGTQDADGGSLAALCPVRLEVSGRPDVAGAVVLASRSEIAAGEFKPFQGELPSGARADWSIRPIGSTALKLARLAAAAGDVFLSRGPKSEWDVCAGALLVEEAGGRVTDLKGEALRYNRPDPYVHGILAANTRLHGAALEQVRQLPPPPRLAHRTRDPLHPGLEED